MHPSRTILLALIIFLISSGSAFAINSCGKLLSLNSGYIGMKLLLHPDRSGEITLDFGARSNSGEVWEEAKNNARLALQTGGRFCVEYGISSGKKILYSTTVHAAVAP